MFRASMRPALLAAGVLASAASSVAQLTHTIPNGFATTSGTNSSAFPWTNLLASTLSGP